MRRSCLFIPANNPGMLQNSSLFNADAIIYDLEDAVSVSEKDSARNLLKNYLKTFTVSAEVIVRINALDSPFFMDDLNEIISDKVDAIMLPKAHIQEIKKLGEILDNLEKVKKINKRIAIVPIIELASSVLEIEEIASLERIDGILLGAEDLSSDMEFERTKSGEEITYPRSKIAYSAAAYKIDAIDTPFTDVKDNEALRKDALMAKRLGLNAKAAIHPNQIAIINEVFSPTAKQIETALRIVMAAKSNKGAFSLDGKMVDKPIVDRSEKLLAKAKKYDLL